MSIITSMSFVEFSYISKDRYESEKQSRLQGSALKAGDMCSGMFSLLANPNGREAVVVPVKFYEIHQTTSALYAAKIALMDADLKVALESNLTITDGFWQDVASNHITFSTFAADSAYFVEYNNGVEDEFGRWTAVALEAV